MCFKRRMKWASRLIFYTKEKGQQSVEAISLGIIILHFPRSNSSHQAHYAHLCSILPFSLSLSVSLESRKIEIRHWNEDHQPETAYNDGTFGWNIAIEPWQRIVVSSTIDVEIPQKEKSICDWLLCVSICLGRKKRKGKFFADERCVLCLLCIRTDGRTDGWHVDWLFQSFSSFGSQVRSSNNFFFFFEKRETKQNKKPTDYTHKEQRATHGESDRVRYTHITTISCVQSVRSIKLRLRLSRGLVGSFVPYVFIDIFIYTCMYV